MHIICDECFKKAQPLEEITKGTIHVTPWLCAYCGTSTPANTTHYLSGDTPSWDVCRTLGVSTKNCSFFDYESIQRDIDVEFETELQKDTRGLANRLIDWLRSPRQSNEAPKKRMARVIEELGKLSSWNNNDPRENIYKRGDILVLHPDGRIGKGQVDTKEGWYLHIVLDNGQMIYDWDTTWLWCHDPRKKN